MTNEPADAELERRYRRLLLAYPRSYRRYRGDEMVATLLDAAAPDQRRPTAAARRDLVVRGLRCRFGVRGGPLAWVGAVFATAVFVVLGACAGNWWDWRDTAPPPGPAETAAIARTVVPDHTPTETLRVDHVYGYEWSTDPAWLVALLGGDDYHAGLVRLAYVPPAGDHDAWFRTVDEARQRLRAAGWTVGAAKRGSHGDATGYTRNYGFSARRDGVVIDVGAYYELNTDPAMAGRDSYLSVDVEVQRLTPALASAPVAAGAGLGLLGGWWFVTALSRRIDRLPRGRRAAASVVSLLALCLQAPVMLVLTLMLTAAAFRGELAGADAGPLWAIYMIIGLRPLSLLSGFVAVLAVAAAVWPTSRTAPAREPAGWRV